jgi:hypothetical protein
VQSLRGDGAIRDYVPYEFPVAIGMDAVGAVEFGE